MINLKLDFHGWKSTSYHWLLIERSVLNANAGGLVPSYELKDLQYEELTISMAECKGLALMTLARIEK